jgi:TatD DNase family protein
LRRLIDLHCHIDLYSDPAAIVRECVIDGAYVLSVTTTPKAWRGTLALAKGASRIKTALGLHPQVAHDRFGELPLFEGLLPEAKYVGEIGLDGSQSYREHASVQVKALNVILTACTKVGGRVMSFHSRGAVDEVLDALERYPAAGTPVLHWFSGTPRQLKRADELGCWFSVGPAMLAGAKGRALAAAMPRNRTLTETDGPFAQIRGRPLKPTDAVVAERILSELWSLPLIETQHRLKSTFRALVALNQ